MLYYFELYMYHNDYFRRKQHSYSACDSALAASIFILLEHSMWLYFAMMTKKRGNEILDQIILKNSLSFSNPSIVKFSRWEKGCSTRFALMLVPGAFFSLQTFGINATDFDAKLFQNKFVLQWFCIMIVSLPMRHFQASTPSYLRIRAQKIYLLV